jgi:hypothetical protein
MLFGRKIEVFMTKGKERREVEPLIYKVKKVSGVVSNNGD